MMIASQCAHCRGNPPVGWYWLTGGNPLPPSCVEGVVLRAANQNNNDCQWQSYHNSVARFHGCGWEPGLKTESFVEKIRGYLGNTIHPTAQNITVFQPHPPLRRHPLQAWRGEERALGGSPPVPLSLRTSAHAGVRYSSQRHAFSGCLHSNDTDKSLFVGYSHPRSQHINSCNCPAEKEIYWQNPPFMV